MFRVAFVYLLLCSVVVADQTIKISQFETDQLNGWKSKLFKGETSYQLVPMQATTVLKAVSQGTASGLFKEQSIDLQQTPFLNWRWRIDHRLSARDEQSKSGDDYVARIYIVKDGGWTFWNTKAISYVWSGSSEKGSIWPSAFAGKNTMMIAVRSEDDPTGVWVQEKRNVLEDLQKFYGKSIRYIDAIAIMTDTDNAGGEAIAYYSDIYFSRN